MTAAININDALERDLVSPDRAERLRRQLGDDSRWSFDAHKTIDYRAQLARLLAAENITIEHDAGASTAAFDIKNRVLILPTWKDISKEVYDLLVLHEVGHALYTPLDGWHNAVTSEGPEFKSYLNVLEDARIEKKIKRKYPGGRRSFVQGYADLLNRDFFGAQVRYIAGHMAVHGFFGDYEDFVRHQTVGPPKQGHRHLVAPGQIGNGRVCLLRQPD